MLDFPDNSVVRESNEKRVEEYSNERINSKPICSVKCTSGRSKTTGSYFRELLELIEKCRFSNPTRK